MSSLQGKRALITGASRGIGRAIAIRLAKAGADIAINFVSNETAARQVASEIQALGRSALLVKADVSQEEDIREMVDSVGQHWGSLGILVSNAASGGFRSLMSASSRNFDAAMHTNVRSLILLVQFAMPYLLKAEANRKVITLSSHGSFRALPDYGLIGACKAAQESLIRHFALELGDCGINFNCVLAGLIATDSTKGIPEVDATIRIANDRMLVGSGKSLKAEDVAEVVHFLSGSSSDLIQGQAITVDGGISIRL